LFSATQFPEPLSMEGSWLLNNLLHFLMKSETDRHSHHNHNLEPILFQDYLGNITHIVNATTGAVTAEYSFDACLNVDLCICICHDF